MPSNKHCSVSFIYLLSFCSNSVNKSLFVSCNSLSFFRCSVICRRYTSSISIIQSPFFSSYPSSKALLCKSTYMHIPYTPSGTRSPSLLLSFPSAAILIYVFKLRLTQLKQEAAPWATTLRWYELILKKV